MYVSTILVLPPNLLESHYCLDPKFGSIIMSKDHVMNQLQILQNNAAILFCIIGVLNVSWTQQIQGQYCHHCAHSFQFKF